MSTVPRLASTLSVLLIGSACASYRGPIPVDRKICMALGAAAGGAGAGAWSNENENAHADTNWAIAGGAAAGAALGYLLCARPSEPLPPTARASADPSSGEAPLTTRFRGEGSDPDGKVVGFAWDFGDGAKASGAEATHTYGSPGEYRARLTVTDDDGLTGSAAVSVRVRGAAVAPPPVARRIVLRGVNFAFDSAEITPESEVILDTAVEALKESSEVRIEVAGHTDWTGTDSYNQGLSERRAKAVADYLSRQGVGASRLRVVGYGETRPVADNSLRDGRAQNRRVELNVLE
jgi:OOP family OmpA-OmpF porin